MRDRSAAPVALVTGASRGIGASTARLLARDGGHRVVVHCREKRRRAEKVVAAIRADGGDSMAVAADLTDAGAVQGMLDEVSAAYGRVDTLVLNASGGLERDAAPDYAVRLNRDAQLGLVDAVAPLMDAGSVIVFVTSNPAHFYPEHPVPEIYRAVARGKRAGEDALRERGPWLSARGIRLAVVSGGMVEGTATVLLLKRALPGAVKGWREQSGNGITVDEFAAAISHAATAELPSGHTLFVGRPMPRPDA